MSGCVTSDMLPKLKPIPAARYPPAAARLGEEGRVLVEFNLDKQRQPFGLRIAASDGSVRLEKGAERLIKSLPFDPSDRSKPRPTHTYRVTAIFCLRPGHCDDLAPFPGTEAIVVEAPKPPESYAIFD